MALSEFSLIDRYFKKPLASGAIGVGDDGAVIPVDLGSKLVVCKDLLVQDRHFFADVNPVHLGHKSLAVNLSDLAAMGAKPVGCLLGLALPAIDPSWLERFAAGLHALSERWACPLIGGDTTSSDHGIVVSVTALGTIAGDQTGLLRSAARVEDDIWVSGQLGAADVALRILRGEIDDAPGRLVDLRLALERPEPPVALGQRLLGVAHAAIDISDGLAQDLGHILKASAVGAVLDIDCLPVHPALEGLESGLIEQAILSGGDVYELCFTARAQQREVIAAIGQQLGVALTRVGQICAQPGLFGRYPDGREHKLDVPGFDHFARRSS